MQLKYENRLIHVKRKSIDFSQPKDQTRISEIIKNEIDEEKFIRIGEPLSLKWKRVRSTCHCEFANFHIHFNSVELKFSYSVQNFLTSTLQSKLYYSIMRGRNLIH